MRTPGRTPFATSLAVPSPPIPTTAPDSTSRASSSPWPARSVSATSSSQTRSSCATTASSTGPRTPVAVGFTIRRTRI